MQSLREYIGWKWPKSWRFDLKAINSWARLRCLYKLRGKL